MDKKYRGMANKYLRGGLYGWLYRLFHRRLFDDNAKFREAVYNVKEEQKAKKKENAEKNSMDKRTKNVFAAGSASSKGLEADILNSEEVLEAEGYEEAEGFGETKLSRQERQKQKYMDKVKEHWINIYEIPEKYLDEDIFLAAIDGNPIIINDPKFKNFKENPEIVNTSLVKIFSDPKILNTIGKRYIEERLADNVSEGLKKYFGNKDIFSEQNLYNFFLNPKNEKEFLGNIEGYFNNKKEEILNQDNKTKENLEEDFKNLKENVGLSLKAFNDFSSICYEDVKKVGKERKEREEIGKESTKDFKEMLKDLGF